MPHFPKIAEGELRREPAGFSSFAGAILSSLTISPKNLFYKLKEALFTWQRGIHRDLAHPQDAKHPEGCKCKFNRHIDNDIKSACGIQEGIALAHERSNAEGTSDGQLRSLSPVRLIAESDESIECGTLVEDQ